MLFLANLVSGGRAGATALIFVYPLDLARTRLVVDVGKGKEQRQFNGLVDCISKIFKSDGLRGLYRGFGTSVLANIIYRGIYSAGYDTLTKIYLRRDSTVVDKFIIAQFVTAIAGLASYPWDTVKRRLMMQSGQKKVLYTSYTDCYNKIRRNEGEKGYYKGALANIIRGAGGSLVLVLYDEFQSLRTTREKD